MYVNIKAKLISEKNELLSNFPTDELTDKEKTDSEEFAQMAPTHNVFSLIQKRSEMRLKKINFLLSRIEEGSFGQCLDCGEHIDETRLEASETSHCLDCQEALEADAARQKKLYKRTG